MCPKIRSRRCPVALLIAMFSFTASALAQQPFVYPAKGQSPEKMARDKAECQGWATQQTGFDPMKDATAQPAPSQQSQRGGVLRGGARGAAAGAAIGAIAGNAGEGAAIGAASGGLMAGAKRRQQQKAEQQAQAQQAQAHSEQVGNFQRAYGACLKGRGYSVE
ncbi:glycine zipper family protein [Methylolobus aquaticus]